jgi:hypothetical protein
VNWEAFAAYAREAGYPPKFTDILRAEWTPNEPERLMWTLMGAITAVGVHIVPGEASARSASHLMRLLCEAYVSACKQMSC